MYVVENPPLYWKSSRVPLRSFATGEVVRDWAAANYYALWPYDAEVSPIARLGDTSQFWPYRTPLREGLYFGKTPEVRGMEWYEYSFLNLSRVKAALLITFAFVATHNHFVLDRGRKIFKQTAPAIKLPECATEDDHVALVAILNTSTACFWLKQVCHIKGGGGIGGVSQDEEVGAETSSLPQGLSSSPCLRDVPLILGRAMDVLVQRFVGATAHKERYDRSHAQMIALQEKLDWDVYHRYGLLTDAEFEQPRFKSASGLCS